MLQFSDSFFWKNIIIFKAIKQYINATMYFLKHMVISKVSLMYEWGTRTYMQL